MFAVTNVDDLLVLAVFFGQAARSRSAAWRIAAGQYIGFTAIVAVAVLGALGAELLPEAAIPYLGLLPLILGVRAAWEVWRRRGSTDADLDDVEGASPAGMLQVAAVTFANGGDNIGVYVPVFAVSGAEEIPVYAVVFLVGVALWCAVGWFLATRRPVAAVLVSWGHIVLPVVLIGLGVAILAEGGAFGL
ncbi:cadmium resistance transporter [Mycolicibacterium iranicum]|nr:cadmium resistance transporter [Mycolicibacterium iranicum]